MTRDIEVLRARLASHRDALRDLQSDAPSDALATHYAQLAEWIDEQLEALSREPEGPAIIREPMVTPPATSVEQDYAYEPGYYAEADEPRRDGVRLATILVIGLAAAGLLAFLFFRFFTAPDRADRAVRTSSAVESEDAVEEILEEPAIIEESEPTPAAVASPVPNPDARLTVEPSRANASGFGPGRSIQQFRVANPGTTSVRIAVERSACRCLWYDFDPVVPSRGAIVVEVTVDGSRLKGDRLDERIGILEAGTGRRLAEIEISGFR